VLRSGCSFSKANHSKDVLFRARADSEDQYRGTSDHREDASGKKLSADVFAELIDGNPMENREPSSARVRVKQEHDDQEEHDGTSAAEEATDPHTRSDDTVRHLRRQHGIHVHGGTAPPLIEQFDELRHLGVPDWLVDNLRTGLKYDGPTPIQMQAIPALLEGQKVIASAPTGSGKTMAFLVPLITLIKGPGKGFARILVVCPTRELAQQSLREFDRLRGSRKFRGRLVDKINFGSGDEGVRRVDFAVTTPLKLVQLLRDGKVTLDGVQYLVLDEADKLLDMGFSPQLDEILSHCTHPSLQPMLFSATIPPAVLQLAESIMPAPLHISVGVDNAANTDVDQRLMFVSSEEGKLLGMRQLLRDGEVKPPCLVFVQDKDRAQQLFSELVYDGLYVDVMHSDKSKTQRDNVIKAFRAGKIWVLICTDLMARGVDFKGVQVVINYDFPQSAATYIHRIGRTGRAGRKGTAITFFTLNDVPYLRTIVNVMRQSGCEVPEWMLKLQKPNKKERRRLEQHPLKRKRIATGSGYDLRQEHRHHDTVEASKRRKRQHDTPEEGANEPTQATDDASGGLPSLYRVKKGHDRSGRRVVNKGAAKRKARTEDKGVARGGSSRDGDRSSRLQKLRWLVSEQTDKQT